MGVTVVQGDIAAQSADALVNAASTSLKMGSGVAGALLHAANGPLERDATAKGPIELGDVVVTDAYDLDAEYVIHAAAMSHSGPHRLVTAESIRDATRHSLELTDYLNCDSIVSPLLGCGSGGFHTYEGAQLMCEEIWDYESMGLRDVRIIGYSNHEVEIFENIVNTSQQ